MTGGIAEQTHRVLQNLGGVLRAAGVSFDARGQDDGVSGGHGEFAAMNEVYATYFRAPAPARATVQAARLPRDVKVEIDLRRPSGRSVSPAVERLLAARSTARTPSMFLIDFITRSRCLMSLISTVMRIDPRWSASDGGFDVADVRVDVGDARADVRQDARAGRRR